MAEIRPIFIIDCFVQSEALQKKLDQRIKYIKNRGGKVMLISNTSVPKHTIESVDLYLYDSENRLFTDNVNAPNIVLYLENDHFRKDEVVNGMQRHGLSVLRNMTKSLKVARAYGYTHFHRLEVDDIMGDKSVDMMMKIPGIVDSNSKKGLFFFNDNESESNISFHYMYCEINLYLSGVRQIETEEDYIEYVRDEMGSETFKIVEDFVRHNVDRFEEKLLALKHNEIYEYFPDTHWNTETSQSNMSSKYKGCSTRLYRCHRNWTYTGELVIYSQSYSMDRKVRHITIEYGDGQKHTIVHTLDVNGSWMYNIVPDSIRGISVFENDELLYTDSLEETPGHQAIYFK